MSGEHWKALARTMKLLREIKGLGLREHAKQIGMPPATLCRIEAGKKCDVDTLLLIREKTGVTLNTLLGIEQP